MKSLPSGCAPLVAAASFLLALPALAQQPAPATPAAPSVAPATVPVGPPRDEIGRYQLLPVPPRSSGNHPVAILLDTQYGRNWSLYVNADGSTVWKRNLVQRFGNLPQGHIAKPSPGPQ